MGSFLRIWPMDTWGWVFVIRAAVVYVAVILLLRLGGKRQIGQLGAAEFVAILLISNAVQNSMNGGDNSVTAGLILACVLIGLSRLVEYVTFKSKMAERLIDGAPTVLIRDGKVIQKHLDKELLSEQELRALLRRQGIDSIREVHIARLEGNGLLSVAKMSDTHQNHQQHGD